MLKEHLEDTKPSFGLLHDISGSDFEAQVSTHAQARKQGTFKKLQTVQYVCIKTSVGMAGWLQKMKEAQLPQASQMSGQES